jgi:PASTA domain
MADDRGPDDTQPFDADATEGMPPVEPGVDETKAMPPVEDAPRWTARAGVPPRATPAPVPWEEESPVEDPYGGRSWFRPIVVGIVALLLAAALGTGVWLIYQSTKRNQGPTITPTPSLATSTAAPTTAAPTSAAPSPTQSPPPATVQIPTNLKGQSQQVASAALTALGLQVSIVRQPSTTVAPGIVIDTLPPGGATVPVGSTVTVVVASLAPSRPPLPSPSRHGTSGSAHTAPDGRDVSGL